MAISKEGVVGYMTKEGSINAVDFKGFIEKINKDRYVYLIDNARIHHSKILKEYMAKQKSKIIYNIPYNPETNPIEHVFSSLKQNIVNYNTNNVNNLRKAIDKVINKVSCDHLNNYFKCSLNI